MTYQICGPEVISELLDDEVIIANLDTGIYYSLRGCGVQIWQLLTTGHSLTTIEALLTKRYGPVSSPLPFIESLVREKLICPHPSISSSSPSLFWAQSYTPPILERYDEMKNLLMLDPIHEVDERGWPSSK